MSKPLSCRVFFFAKRTLQHGSKFTKLDFAWYVPFKAKEKFDQRILTTVQHYDWYSRNKNMQPTNSSYVWLKQMQFICKTSSCFSIREVVLPSSGGSSAVTWIHYSVTDEDAQFKIYCGCLLVNHYRKNKKYHKQAAFPNWISALAVS